MTPGVERRAARAVDDAAARLADGVREAAPRARVEVERGRVTVTGRGLERALRWPGGLLR